MDVELYAAETEIRSMLKRFGSVLFIYSSLSLAQTIDEGVQSGRYQVRGNSAVAPSGVNSGQVEKAKVTKKHVKRKPVSMSAGESVPVDGKEAQAVDKAVDLSGSANTKSPQRQDSQSQLGDTQSGNDSEGMDAPSYSSQFQDLINGKHQTMDAYKQQIHPDDIRLNRLEINFTPGVLYYDSKSNYSFRNCQSFSPFARLGGEIWWTPMLGIYGQYGQTYGADVVDDSVLKTRERATHELIEGGLDFRKFFGLSRKSNSIIFGLHYNENKFSVRADSVARTNTRSSGFGLHFGARVPTAPSYSWIFMARMEPKLSHSESGTALNLNSGTSPESSRFGIDIGGEFKMSRSHQLIWTLSSSVEKNQYSGSAGTVDPETGAATSGVSVTQGFTSFSLGYRWGQ